MHIISCNIQRGFDEKINILTDKFSYPEILCLQETVSNTKIINESKIYQDGNYKIISNTIDNNYLGTSMLIRNDIEFNDKTTNVINIYGPPGSTKEKQNFFQSLHNHIINIYNEKEYYILIGDFNVTENKIDSKNDTYYSQIVIDLLINITKIIEISDVFRNKFPDKILYTWSNTRGSASRIDRAYISNNLLTSVTHLNHHPNTKSDHKILSLKINLDSYRWGRGFWKFNNSVLTNNNYKSAITKFWEFWQKEKTNFRHSNEWWDKGKQEIQSITKTFCIAISKIKQSKLKLLYSCLEDEEQTQKPDQNKINKIKNDITHIEDYKNEGYIIRSKLDINITDKSNIDIYKIAEEKNACNKKITQLQNNHGEIHTTKQDIPYMNIIQIYIHLKT
ncbi:hypothetical protein SNE40_018116 [Patella caerulea]|uniref:Endonuclease/exonuclease/phosphatase domain-containing protein n=1 Tax=Patella caerulea TaxID=87958 RepID=A0AAN8PAB4_PATCE